jgi:FMN-dependent NADH-azoreductase
MSALDLSHRTPPTSDVPAFDRSSLHLLHLDSSAQRERSLTRRLTEELVRAWTAEHPETGVVYRDLAASPPPFVDERWIEAAFAPQAARGPGRAGALDESDRLVDELLWADVIVIGMPMYNFTVPATVKAYLDQVVRPGRTFEHDGGGRPHGLATGKRVVVETASIGDYGPGSPLAAMNHLDGYLRTILGFMGMTDVSIVNVHGHDLEAAAPSIAAARARFAALVAQEPAGLTVQ